MKCRHVQSYLQYTIPTIGDKSSTSRKVGGIQAAHGEKHLHSPPQHRQTTSFEVRKQQNTSVVIVHHKQLQCCLPWERKKTDFVISCEQKMYTTLHYQKIWHIVIKSMPFVALVILAVILVTLLS